MIKLGKPQLPKDIFIGFSGGVDSVAALDFLATRHNVTLLHVDHGDDVEEQEREVVVYHAERLNIKYQIHGGFDKRKAKTSSMEGAWRNFRYKIFNSMENPVVTCHHLDDCVESYLFSCFQGVPSTIRPVVDNVYRPFLLSNKHDFIERAERKCLYWAEDESNKDPMYCRRNYIRNTLMPHVLHVNPGIKTVVRKMVLAAYKQYE